MISIREDVFETNSSSCHCLTIAKKSFLDGLKKKELFYIGDYSCCSDSDEVFVNDLMDVKEEDYLTFAQVKDRAKEWLKKEPDDEYEKRDQEAISKLDLDNCTVEEFEKAYDDTIEEFINTYLDEECEYPGRIIGGDDDYESTVLWQKEFPYEDDKQVITLMEVMC